MGTGVGGCRAHGAGVATPPMARGGTLWTGSWRGRLRRDASEGAMAAAKLWGGQAAEIEILEISAGVRMGK